MVADNPYTRTFRRAIDTLGGIQELARTLGVTVEDLQGWASGLVIPPPGVFLKAIDIVALGPSRASEKS
jgi:DNA-binding transcriptional regulator YiaG